MKYLATIQLQSLTVVLGEAFEPEERFENPDGSTIIFDRDYFGNHRSLKAVPGPFATAEAATWNL